MRRKTRGEGIIDASTLTWTASTELGNEGEAVGAHRPVGIGPRTQESKVINPSIFSARPKFANLFIASSTLIYRKSQDTAWLFLYFDQNFLELSAKTKVGPSTLAAEGIINPNRAKRRYQADSHAETCFQVLDEVEAVALPGIADINK